MAMRREVPPFAFLILMVICMPFIFVYHVGLRVKEFMRERKIKELDDENRLIMIKSHFNGGK